MLRRITTISWFIAALVVVLLGGRLCWLASQAETGFETCRLHWQTAAISLVGSEPLPIYMQLPSEQAEYWLDEVDQLLMQHPGDSAAVMGGAFVLRNPAPYWQFRILLSRMRASPYVDYESLQREENKVQRKCNARSRELASLAHSSDPANVELLQLYAMVDWERSAESERLLSKLDNQLELLEEYAARDPENGLYDYIAALYCWSTAGEINKATGVFVENRNQAVFERGSQYFERGLKKPLLSMGFTEHEVVMRFLEHTSLPKIQQAAIVPNVSADRELLVREVLYWQNARSQAAKYEGDPKKALKLQCQTMEMITQWHRSRRAVNDAVSVAMIRSATSHVNEIALKFPSETTSIQQQEFFDLVARVDELSAQGNRAIRQVEMQEQRLSLVPSESTGALATVVKRLQVPVVKMAPVCVIVLLLLGCVAGLIGLASRRRELPRSRPIASIAMFVGALAVSTALFGLAPTGLIPPEYQAWIFSLLLVGFPIAIGAWLSWKTLRGRTPQFSLRTLMLLSFGMCLVFGLISIARPISEGDIYHFPWPLAISPISIDGISPDIRSQLSTSETVFADVAQQWVSYRGIYTAAITWLVCVGWWIYITWPRETVETNQPFKNRMLDYLGAISQSIAKSASWLILVLLAIYLAIAPSDVRGIEQDFQTVMNAVRDRDGYWAKVDAAIADEVLQFSKSPPVP